MSPPEVWGPAVWTLFHTLIEKVNDQAYPFIKVQLFGQIRRICGFLPCPECSADATNFLAKVNINDLKTKVDFRNTFYVFHNMVNAKKRKPLFNYSKLASYKNYGIVYVVNNFISKYNTKGNMKLLAESFQRKMVLGEFKSWFTKTIRAFTPPQNIPSLISVSVVEESTITTEDAAILTEEIVIEASVEEVAEEVIATEDEVVSEASEEESTITTENAAILTEEVIATEEEVISEASEEVISEASEEVVSEASEEVIATEDEVVTVEEVAVEEVVQPKPKKGRKPKKQ